MTDLAIIYCALGYCFLTLLPNMMTALCWSMQHSIDPLAGQSSFVTTCLPLGHSECMPIIDLKVITSDYTGLTELCVCAMRQIAWIKVFFTTLHALPLLLFKIFLLSFAELQHCIHCLFIFIFSV